MFFCIFEQTSPLSKYFQARGMDVITAPRLGEGTEEGLRECAIGTLKELSVQLRSLWCGLMKSCKRRKSVSWQCRLPFLREGSEREKRMPGEVAEDEHQLILTSRSKLTVSLWTQWQTVKLCSGFVCLDPRNFAHVKENGLPSSALEEISKCLLRFDDRATVDTLCSELCSLACQWDRLKMSPLEGYTGRTASEMQQGSEEDSPMEEQDVELESKTCLSCHPLSVQSTNGCLPCDWTGLQGAINTVHHTDSLSEKFLNREIHKKKQPDSGALWPRRNLRHSCSCALRKKCACV